jgi:hypothetical protein
MLFCDKILVHSLNPNLARLIRDIQEKKKIIKIINFTIFVSFLDLMLELTIQMTDKKVVHRELFYCFVQKKEKT